VATDYGSFLHKLAKAFDVPLEFLELKPEPKPEPIMASGGSMAAPGVFKHLWEHDWEHPVAQLPTEQTIHFELSGALTPEQWKEIMGYPPSPITQVAVDLAVNGDACVALHEDGTVSSLPLADHQIASDGTVKKLKLSNHVSGMAVDINMAEDHMHFEPDPSAPYLEGDGDIDSIPKPAYMSFDVLGKAQPLVVQPPYLPMIWETALGKVELTGVVSTAQGSYQLGAELVTLDPQLAKQLIGVIPNDGPGTGNCFLEAAAGDQLFTWEAGTGWIPKPVYAPLHASFPEVSTTKGGVKFGYGAAEEPLFDPTEAPYGWFCTVCEEHMIVHKGDPVACDSAGSVRPATSAEHKLAVLTGGTPS
jgi:hypothetical protein